MAHLENIWIYPIKGLDAISLDTSTLSDAGTLCGDRAYAMVDADGTVLNGKQIQTLHEVSMEFDPEREVLTLSVAKTDETVRFDLSMDRGEASEWLSSFFGKSVELRRREPPAFVDRPSLGPSVISTGTLEEVASWFGDVSPDEMRARLRPNVVIGGVPPFWEDRFLEDSTSGFEINGVRFEGAEACARCVVPSLDPETGEPIEDFQARFVERRKETFPVWADERTLKHFYTVMVIMRVPEPYYGETIRVGDPVKAPDIRD